MPRRKPETLALAVSLAGRLIVLLVFMADLVVARHRDLESGERRLQHFGIMMAEHTARTFEAVDVLLRETATDLSHSRRDWENWEASRGWEYIAQRHSRAMPQLRDLIIFDSRGDQRFISTYFPAPRINVRDRPYFAALESGAESATFGPYICRNSPHPEPVRADRGACQLFASWCAERPPGPGLSRVRSTLPFRCKMPQSGTVPGTTDKELS